MKLSTISAFAILTALAAGNALAASADTQHPAPPTAEGKKGPGFGGPGGHGPRGPVTREDWNKKFDRIDANHDNTISPEEMKAHHDKMREKFKGNHPRPPKDGGPEGPGPGPEGHGPDDL